MLLIAIEATLSVRKRLMIDSDLLFAIPAAPLALFAAWRLRVRGLAALVGLPALPKRA